MLGLSLRDVRRVVAAGTAAAYNTPLAAASLLDDELALGFVLVLLSERSP
jgi:H+/Cl- antiporter ClcA